MPRLGDGSVWRCGDAEKRAGRTAGLAYEPLIDRIWQPQAQDRHMIEALRALCS